MQFREVVEKKKVRQRSWRTRRSLDTVGSFATFYSEKVMDGKDIEWPTTFLTV
jgi:hypothetical protein